MPEREYQQLLYLLACALHNKAADLNMLGEINHAKLYRIAQKHLLGAITCMALEQAQALPSNSEQRKQWLEAKNKAIRKNVLLRNELQALSAELESAHIWHIPLKGSIIQDWYPQFGMREMSDVDVLFDPAFRADVRRLFEKRGYTTKLYNINHEDVYEKQPVYLFEMHISLFGEINEQNLVETFNHFEQYAHNVGDMLYRKELDTNSFYCYFVAHSFMHYSAHGTGLRTLLDFYVVNQQLKNKLDPKRIAHILNSIGAYAFEQELQKLTTGLFGGTQANVLEALSEKQLSLLSQFCDSAAFGNTQHFIDQQLAMLAKENGNTGFSIKAKYLIKRLFPNRTWCKERYPLVYKYPVLLPAFWIWRFVRKGLLDKQAFRELTALSKH